MKIIESLRNFFTKKNIKELCKKIWGKEPEPVDESVFDDPDRYVKFDEWKDNQYWEDKKRYKREKRILCLRRFIVSFLVLVISINIITIFVNAIRYNTLFSCLFKDACIVRGPKTPLPFTSCSNFEQNGETIILLEGDINYGYRKYIRPFLNNVLYRTKIDKRFEPDYKIRLYAYNKNFNIFRRLKYVFDATPERLLDTPVALNSQNQFIFTEFMSQKTIHIIDLNKQKIIRTNLCNFSKNCQYEPNNLFFIKQYDADRAIVMSQNNNMKYDNMVFSSFYRRYGYYCQKLTAKENMYIFDLKNLTFKQLPDFAIPLKYYPAAEDIIVLKNGKIIVPIRNKNTDEEKEYWDHIEIYDPKENKFFAEKNTDVMKNNIFIVDFPNNDLLFINKDSSYFFINSKNKFIKANEEETSKNQMNIDILKMLMLDNFGLELGKVFSDIEIIKVGRDKFFLTCKFVSTNSEPICNNTIYFNYTKNTIKKGPKFLFNHGGVYIIPLSENSVIFLGGHESHEGRYAVPLNPNYVPNKYTQILKVKN